MSGVANAGRLALLAGPAGVGKGTVVARILADNKDFAVSVSATTRTPRPGEVDGTHYHFWSRERFLAAIAAGELLEWAEVHGANLYGTPRSEVEHRLAAGTNVILEIDVQGVRQIKSAFPAAVSVFIAPPSVEELERRLAARGTETLAEQQVRLATARQEMASIGEFDFVVVNESVGECAAAVVDLIRGKA